jgi:hypothetical protein
MLGIAFGFVYTWIEDGSSDSRFSKLVDFLAFDLQYSKFIYRLLMEGG